MWLTIAAQQADLFLAILIATSAAPRAVRVAAWRLWAAGTSAGALRTPDVGAALVRDLGAVGALLAASVGHHRPDLATALAKDGGASATSSSAPTPASPRVALAVAKGAGNGRCSRAPHVPLLRTQSRVHGELTGTGAVPAVCGSGCGACACANACITSGRGVPALVLCDANWTGCYDVGGGGGGGGGGVGGPAGRSGAHGVGPGSGRNCAASGRCVRTHAGLAVRIGMGTRQPARRTHARPCRRCYCPDQVPGTLRDPSRGTPNRFAEPGAGHPLLPPSLAVAVAPGM